MTRAAAPAASEVLVSNLGQSQGLGGSFRLYDLAQGFRTGDNAGGYTLTAVDLQMSNAAGDISTISASVWSVSGGKPDGNLGALTNPGSLDTNRIARFTAPGIDLEPSTGYIVVFDSTGAGGSPSLTRSDDEDAGRGKRLAGLELEPVPRLVGDGLVAARAGRSHSGARQREGGRGPAPRPRPPAFRRGSAYSRRGTRGCRSGRSCISARSRTSATRTCATRRSR